MRIHFKTDGGIAAFPGLSRPVSINSDDLSPAEADQLKRRIDEARFFEQPAIAEAAARGAADYRQYTITVEDKGRSHTVRFVDPVKDPGLQALVDFLNMKTKAMRVAARAEAGKKSSDKG